MFLSGYRGEDLHRSRRPVPLIGVVRFFKKRAVAEDFIFATRS